MNESKHFWFVGFSILFSLLIAWGLYFYAKGYVRGSKDAYDDADAQIQARNRLLKYQEN